MWCVVAAGRGGNPPTLGTPACACERHSLHTDMPMPGALSLWHMHAVLLVGQAMLGAITATVPAMAQAYPTATPAKHTLQPHQPAFQQSPQTEICPSSESVVCHDVCHDECHDVCHDECRDETWAAARSSSPPGPGVAGARAPPSEPGHRSKMHSGAVEGW